MNPRILAAMNELNQMNWDDYLSPSKLPLSQSQPQPQPQSHSQSHSITSKFQEKNESDIDNSYERNPEEGYSGYVFEDPLAKGYPSHQPDQESHQENQLNSGLNSLSNQNQDLETESIEQIPEGRYVNDDESNNSEEPVLSGEADDDLGLDSPDSLSTKDSFNDQEILAHNNAIKNKDLLHESFLIENNRPDGDQNASVNRDSGGNAHSSVEGDTKSVTFADEDSIYEYDRLDGEDFPPPFPYDSYPDMDPNSIPSSDREEVTRRYMVQAVREDEKSHQQHPQSQHYAHYLPDDMYPSHPHQLVDDEKDVARQRFEQLYSTSPEFRAAVMSYPNPAVPIMKHESPSRTEKPKITAKKRNLIPKIRQTKDRLKSRVIPFAESSVADSLDPMTDLESIEFPKKNRPNKSALPRVSMPKQLNPKDNSKHDQAKKKGQESHGQILMSKTLPTPANEHIIRLAQDVHRATPSLEFAPPPPKLSTDCLTLPFDDVMKLAELNPTGDSYCIVLNPGEEKIRLKAKYYANLSDWESSNRLDFFGLHFFRSELLQSSHDSTLNDLTTHSTLAVVPSPLTETQQTSLKKKLVLSHDDVTDYLFVNHTKDIRKNSPNLFQLDSFVKETYTGFVCLVFDMKMQLLGTFEPHRRDSFPGLTLCPPFLNYHKKKKRHHDTHLANLLEIDIINLPVETFAVVPVFYDDCPFGAKFPEITFQLDVSALDPLHDNHRAGAYWIPGGIEQDSEVTPIHDLFDVEKDIEIPLVTPPPSHVSSEELDPGWSHVESYFCNRETKILETTELEGPPPIDPDHLQTQSKMVKLGHQQSFIPFVFFRLLDSKKNPNVNFVPISEDNLSKEEVSNQKINHHQNRQWGMKSIQQSFNGVMFHTIVRGALETLKSKHILPYHVMNIEHCIRCDLHSMTTWHVPGSYEKWFADLKRMLRKSLPPALIYSNKFTNTESQPPRLGSFELFVRPYSSDCTQLVFSKLSSRTLPPTETILRDLAVLLLPETVRFEGSHILELHIYDHYSKKPLKGATISLYKTSVGLSLQSYDLEKEFLQEKTPYHPHQQDEQDEEYDDGWTNIKKNRHKMRIENAKRNTEVNQARASMFKQSYSHKQKDQQPVDYTTKLITSGDTTYAHFRHSSVYFKVRSWKAEDISLWFKSFSIGKDVVDRAFADGMIDGPSFLALANQQSFEKWGVRNKIKLERMNKSLENILSTSNDKLSDPVVENISSQNYDPFTDTYPTLSKQTQIKQCEPGRPKPAYLKDDFNLKLVSTKRTDSRGLGFISVDCAGTFFLRIESASSIPYCSNAFQIFSSGHTGFCASMTPRIGIADITITLSDDPSENNSIPSGLLVSMMNLSSGKRHIAFAKRTSEKVLKSPQSPISDSDDIFPSRRPSTRFAPPKRALTMDVPQKKPGSLARQASVGAILLNEMTNSWKGGNVLTQSKQPTAPEHETRVLETIIWLPVGKYFSEVNGQVFEVKEDESGKLASNVNYWNPSEGVDTEIIGNEPVSLQFTLSAAQKCHRRILLGSIRAFQKIYRRYKKDFLTKNLWAYLALKKHLRRYLKYIRGMMAERKSTKIAKTYRMFAERKRYQFVLACVVTIQCALRRYRSRKRVGVIRRARILILRLLSRYVVQRCAIRNRRALQIQCRARSFLAKIEFNRRLVRRRIYRALKRWLGYNEKRKYSFYLRECQEYEQYLMEYEEEYQREYLRQYQAEERKKMIAKAQLFERRRYYYATRIQTFYRGYHRRKVFKIALRGMTRLQKIFRLRRFEEKIKQKLQVKYVIGFPSLGKHPRLLGATKLLQGLELAPKPLPPPPPSPKFIDQILEKLLAPPAVKIQSVLRMFLIRMKYIRSWRKLKNSDESMFPPLYRYLIPIVLAEPLESDEISHQSEKFWDNGAQTLLHELGYTTRVGEVDNPPLVEELKDNAEYEIEEESVGPVRINEYLSQVVPRDRRITRLEDQKLNRAAIKIQSFVRRYLARKVFITQIELSRQLSNKYNSPPSLIGSPKKSGKLIQALKNQSNVIKSIQSFSLGDTIKKSLSRTLSSTSEITETLGKPLLRTISKELIHAVDSGVKSVKLASDTVVTKYNERTEQIKENNEKLKSELIRKDRIQNNEFCVEDAVFNLRGRPADVPRMNRSWYVGVFPQLDEYEIDIETLQTDMLSGHDLEQAYEMTQDRLIGEAVRTPELSPLSKETFENINFNLHFADLQRYTRLLVVLFIETSEESGRIRTDALPSHIAIPTVKQSNFEHQTPKFLPLFYGSCQLNGGLAYPPGGGRLTFFLHPNPNQAIIFSKSQAKRLSNLKYIEMQGTLIPIAVPSSKFLRTLNDPKATVPSYPSELLDAFLFEKNEIHTKEFYGAAICMLRFESRNLISTRHRGVPNGITEFSQEGKSLGKVIEYREDIGTVTSMSGGKQHFIVCGSTGAFCIYSSGTRISENSLDQTSLQQSADLLRNSFDCVRFQALHRWPIVMSSSIHRAGVDFFFTVDRQNNIGVIIMENRTCVRSYLNEQFVQARITCCQATRDRLYLGLHSGHLVTINLYPILSGQIDNAKKLVEFITDREIIFPEDCGISALGVMSAADYFGLLNEDIAQNIGGSLNHSEENQQFTSTNVRIKPKQKLVGMRLKPKKTALASNETCFQKNSRLKPGRPLEGHILIIAGGDKYPVLKVLSPIHPKPASGSAFCQIAQLPGHGKSASQIVTDAAGRFIVSCSQGSRSIAVWNGITFNCERTYENVNVGFMGVGDNSLFVCSFKAPFLTIYQPDILVENKVSKKRHSNSPSVISETTHGDPEDLEELSIDGRPDIAMVRTSVWCLTTVTGGKIIPQKSLAPASQFLGECGRRVVEDWRVFYNRAIKKIVKSPPPISSVSIKKTASMGSLPPIHEASRSKRRELQKLASGSYSPAKSLREEKNESLLDTQSQITFDNLPSFQQSETDQSHSQYDWQPGYDYKYGCYYDENGYAYNYDQNGNYFYYDASWYEQFVPQPAASPAQISKPLDAERSLTSDSYITEGFGFNSQEELNGGSFLQIGESSFQSPSQLPYSPVPDSASPSHIFSGNYLNSSPYQTPFLDRHKQSMSPLNLPHSSSSFNEDDPKLLIKSSSKFNQNSADYDRYGKYIGSDLDKYDGDPPRQLAKTSSRHLDQMAESAASLPLTVISLKRRHMHMSDSDEDEDERMESIYRQKNQKSNQSEIPCREKFVDREDHENEEKGWQDEVEQNYSARTQGSDHSGIISIREERQKIMKEREKLIQRGLLHHLADDSDESDV